jgi:hypothetical protein
VTRDIPVENCTCGEGTPNSDALAGHRRPPELGLRCGVAAEAKIWRILAALNGRTIRGVRLRSSDAGEGIPPWGEMPDIEALKLRQI